MTDTLVAKANTGAGTDQLAVDMVPGGAAGVVKVALGAPGVVDSYLGQTPLPVAISGTVPISSAAPLTVAAQDLQASGALSALNSTVQLDTTGQTSVGVQVVGTYVGTLIFEATINGTNWVTVSAVATANGAIVSTLASAAQGIWQMSVGAYAAVRVRVATYTSGTANVSMRGSMFGPEAVAIDNPIPAGANAIGSVSVSSVAAGTSLIGDVGLQVRANATGAGTPFHLVSAASTNATVIKASAGRVYAAHYMNNGLATVYVKMHNVATLPVAGTTAVHYCYAIQPAGSICISYPQGIGFSAGIGVTVVLGAANNSTMAVGANEVVGHVVYA